ncbi:MAG: BON domain-containing protein [Betaproteobacteria bacterium]|nr:BON domain-containing protein [Betaproteobacteria bacterium]MDH4325188.1 BON domain-containing protein [Betaproteobacteria bacterium]MDH5211515.1 BON domain-containing protein [Betaproteobacteria bacterium]MDH5579134.1 BON domain-containing protein [Betaproteobacteria bacterium]
MTLFKRIATFFMAALLLTAMGCASTSERSSTGEYIDDSVITTKVKTAIFNEPDLKVLQISVETYKQVVQLSGFVGTYAQITKAGNVAREVAGVRSVSNDLKIK